MFYKKKYEELQRDYEILRDRCADLDIRFAKIEVENKFLRESGKKYVEADEERKKQEEKLAKQYDNLFAYGGAAGSRK